ncbi:MAG: hypothetical protein ABW136_04075 [Steroidobacteraceae bacterium]
MKLRHTAWAVLVVAAGAFSAAPASADVRVGIRIAPPAERVVIAPAPRAGYVWAPGYWRWTGRHHVWIDGRHLKVRRNQVWIADRWDHRGDDWVYVRGHWARAH